MGMGRASEALEMIVEQLEVSNKLKRMELLLLSAVYDDKISDEDMKKLNEAFKGIML